MKSQIDNSSRGLTSPQKVFFAFVFLFVSSGCERDAPRVYDIPVPIEPQSIAWDAHDNHDVERILQSEGLMWGIPEFWSEAPIGPMRLAVYTASQGAVELSVSRFPGDVGGDLANINRWRRQLGLYALSDLAAVDGLVIETNGVSPGQRIELYSVDGTGMYMHWFSFEGHTWFFKATGSREDLLRMSAEFDQWIQSIDQAPNEE